MARKDRLGLEEMWSCCAKYLRRWIDKYDAVIVSCPEYKHEMRPPQRVFMPAINPFNIKNRELSDKEMDERLAHYKIPTDLPLVVQISRFDPWKDPQGVVEAFKLARKEIDARLVLLGNFATDDPEGAQIFEALRACQEERILILTSGDDTALVNALQTRGAVVLQKSLREGFGRRSDVECAVTPLLHRTRVRCHTSFSAVGDITCQKTFGFRE